MCSFAHLAIQYTKATGLSVCAIDIDDGKLEHAKRIGADLVFNGIMYCIKLTPAHPGRAHLFVRPISSAIQPSACSMIAAFVESRPMDHDDQLWLAYLRAQLA
jgi:D-arabinose 1-dehydrogenase-like Zn-dependent alcohol dehydrogenase